MRFCSLGSGSSGNSTLVEASQGITSTRLLVDAGFSARELTRRLARAGCTPAELDALFITHEHGDHIGCALAFAYSAAHGICPAADADRVAAHWRAVGLPDGLAAAGITASGATLVDHMRHDKKMAAGTLPFLLARGIGQTYLDKTVALTDVETFLDAQPR